MKYNFSCTSCGDCCRHEPGYVYLSLAEISKMVQFLRISIATFLQEYCRVVPSPVTPTKYCYSLLEKPNYDCIFYKDQGCSVYPVRPTQCKTYPFWPYIIESKRNWELEAAVCPGMNIGKEFDEVTAHEIASFRKNVPIYEFEKTKEGNL